MISRNPFLDFLERYERLANADPDKQNKPVICLRKADVDEDAQREVWGPNWKQTAMYNERQCTICRETVIVRTAFRDQKVIVCQVCAPAFIEGMMDGMDA